MSAIDFVDLTQAKPIGTNDFTVAGSYGVRYRPEYSCWAIVDPVGWIEFELDWPDYRTGGANFVLRLCSATVQGVSDCPINVAVNDNVIVSSFDPHIDNYYHRAWYIPERLFRAGMNRIVFRLKEGRTQVFIQRAWVVQYDLDTQLQTQWCWTAVATSIVMYYRPGSSWNQKKVVEATYREHLAGPLGEAMRKNAEKFDGKDALDNGEYGAINAPSFVNLALHTLGNLRSSDGFAGPETSSALNEKFGSDILWRALDFEELQVEANEMRPVVACMSAVFGKHFVVVTGVSDSGDPDNRMVAVQDPRGDCNYIRYEDLKDRYLGVFKWVYTCLTQRRAIKA